MLRSRLKHWLVVTPYLLGGFASFLSYLLVLRFERVGYVYHYVPSVSNPILLTPFLDVTVWAAITAILFFLASFTCWRQFNRLKSITLIVLISSAVSGSAFSIFFGTIPWLILFSTVPILVLIYKPLGNLDRGRCFEASAYAVIGTWLLIEVGSAAFQILSRLGIYSFPHEVGRQITGVSLDLMYTFQSRSALLFLMMGFSWVGIPLLFFARRLTHFSKCSVGNRWLGFAVFLASVTLAMLAIAISFFRCPDLYGVDTRYYLDRLAQITSLRYLLSILATDPRLFYTALLKILTFLGASNELAVKLGPLILTGLNTCAFYILGEEIVGDRLGGGTVALSSALGLETAVSLYAGIYANWLSMFLMASAFASYIHGVKTERTLFIFLSGLFLLTGLIAHPWSGVFYSLIMICMCFLEIDFKKARRHLVLANTALVIAIALFYLVTYFYTPYAHVSNSILSLHSLFQLSNYDNLNHNLTFTMDYMVGGFLSMPFSLVTALVGFSGLYLDKRLSTETRLVTLWLFLTLMPVLFVESWAQWRIIYLMPIQVLSGLGIYYLCQALALPSRGERRGLIIFFLVAAVITMFNYLLRSAAFIPSF